MSVEILPWQDEIWRSLQELIAQQRLPHALLLSGHAGLGKINFAERLAAALVCPQRDAQGEACGHCPSCHTRAAGSHPDIRWVRPEEDKKSIQIDSVREATARSVLAAEGEGYKVFIVDPADQLTHAAANALLKTLEEPTDRTLLLLITSIPERLPATIRSRCQRIRMQVPSDQVARAWLGQQAEGDQALKVLGVAGGAPLLALEMTRDGRAEQVVSMRCGFIQLIEGKVNPIALAADWHKKELNFVLRHLSQWIIDLIRLKTQDNPPLLFSTTERADLHRLAQRIQSKRLFRCLDDIVLSQRQLTHNPNVQLTLEHHLSSCSQLMS